MHSSLPFPPSFSYLPAEGGFLSAGDKGHPEAAVIGGSGMGEAEPLRVWRGTKPNPRWLCWHTVSTWGGRDSEETTDEEGQIHPSFSFLFMATTDSSAPRTVSHSTGFVKQCANHLLGHMGLFQVSEWTFSLWWAEWRWAKITETYSTRVTIFCLSDKIKGL